MTRRRLAATLALLAAIAVVVVIVLSTQSSTPATASGGAPRPSAGTTTVQRRDLVQTDTESGTLTYSNPQTVYNRISGTITWLPNVGQLIKPGQALFKVDGAPVILMNGNTPAFRDLNGYDAAGPDIYELNRNLVALGDNPDGIVVDDTWQAATTAGVDILQASLGETETGDLTLGQIVFLPGDQLVSTLDATVGATGGSAGGAGSTGASYSVRAPRAEFVSLTTTQTQNTTTTPTTTTGTTPTVTHKGGKGPLPKSASALEKAIALLESEVAKLQSELASAKGGGGGKSGGGTSGGGKSGGGKSGGAGSHNSSGGSSGSGSGSGSSGGGSSNGSGGTASAVLETSSRKLVVTVDLDASKQSEATVGEKVTVQMPSGQTVPGKITAVSPVAQSSSSGSGASAGAGGSGPGGGGSSGSSSTIPVTIALTGRARGAGLDQAAVSVNFVQAEAKHVLSVPVTALLAIPGGRFAVQTAASPRRLIPVRTGLFAAGYVQVSGSGIQSGLSVTDSEG